MKLFNGIFSRQGLRKEARGMAVIGRRAVLAKKVLEAGGPNGRYDGMVTFPDVVLDMASGYGCDAVGVAVLSTKDLVASLVDGGYLATGIFVHLGLAGTRMKTWCNVENVTEEDLVRIGRAVDEAVSNEKKKEGNL